MNIKLISLSLSYFKGIISKTINFQDETILSGQNAVGKSTIADAFYFLLWGKNSQDEKTFEIKTLDKNNKPLPKLDHEVIGVLEVDKRKITLRHGYREKWVTRRGSTELYMDTHEHYYEIDLVPKNAGEYAQFISALIPEKIFKLITNPFAFNKLEWPDRRKVLLDIGGEITDTDILFRMMKNKHTEALKKELAAQKSIEDYKKQLAAQKKLVKDKLEAIPGRIDEANRAMPAECDYGALQAEVTVLEQRIKEIDESLQDASQALATANNDRMTKQRRLNELQREKQQIEFNTQKEFLDEWSKRSDELNQLQREINTLNREINGIKQDIHQYTDKIQNNANKMATLRSQYAIEDAKEVIYPANLQELKFNEDEFTCPACKRPFPPEDIETRKHSLECNFKDSRTAFLQKFNTDKVTRLKTINTEGLGYKNDNEAFQLKLTDLQKELTQKQEFLTGSQGQYDNLKVKADNYAANATGEYNKLLAENADYEACKNAISDLEGELSQPITAAGNDALKSEKNGSSLRLKEINIKLSGKAIRETQSARITELDKEQRELAQQQADFEGYEFAIQQYNKIKMSLLVENINHKFKFVKFKMFEEQINGGEKEICETLIPGDTGLVPWSDANTGGRILAGIFIINVLSEHYGYSAPIFLDNAEALSQPVETKSQLIKLVVSEQETLSVYYPAEKAVKLETPVKVTVVELFK